MEHVLYDPLTALIYVILFDIIIFISVFQSYVDDVLPYTLYKHICN